MDERTEPEEQKPPVGVVYLRQLLRLQAAGYLFAGILTVSCLSSESPDLVESLRLSPGWAYFFFIGAVALGYLALLVCERNTNTRTPCMGIGALLMVLNVFAFGIVGWLFAGAWGYTLYRLNQREEKDWLNQPPRSIDFDKHTYHFVALGIFAAVALAAAGWMSSSPDFADMVRMMKEMQ